MDLIKKLKTLLFVFVIFVSCTVSLSTFAGFLDMPDISETPKLERKSMLRDIDVPGVQDRNPDPNEGPRIAVFEFKIQGLVEYPELGITRKALNDLVEAIRYDLMAEGKLLDSGYTIDELGELSDLLVEIEEDTKDRHVTSIEVQKLVWLIREQRSKRGITLGQIETIADKITRYYRTRGFILAKAYIPKQQVREGIVNLTLLLGTLGEVEAKGNKLYKDSILKSVFDDMLAKPVTNDAVEENLYIINDFPGIQVEGYFEPGYQVGDTKLNINVKNEERISGNVRLDNHGTKETGKNRVYVEAMINNPIGNADLLHLSTLSSFAPDNTTYWDVKYQTNLFSPRWRLGLRKSKNQFVLDQDDTAISSLELSGEVTQQEISTKYIIERGRTRNYSAELKYEEILSDLQIGELISASDLLDDKINNTSIQFNYDILQEKKKRLHLGNVKLTSGEFVFGAETGQDNSYLYLNTDYTFMTFWKVPYFGANTRIISRTSFQYSGSKLSPISQFALAGPTRVRAYPTNQFSADDAIYTGVDWVFNSPGFFDFNVFGTMNFKDIAKPFLFADYAYGIQKSLVGDDDETGQLFDIGFGLQLSFRDKFRGNLQIAFPIAHSFSSVDIDEPSDNANLVFDFQYSF